MSMVWKTMAITLGMLIAGNIAGSIALIVLDVLHPRFFSGALGYVLWFVFGVFMGIFTYAMSLGWISKSTDESWAETPAGRRAGVAVVVIAAAVLVVLTVLFWFSLWRLGPNTDYFIPDSMSHTLTLFIAMLVTLIGTHLAFGSPQASGSSAG